MTENELSKIVIGEAIKVHQQVGPGLLESAYETCLAFHLDRLGLKVERQKSIPLVYEDLKMECGFRCDLMINGILIIEIKAIDQFDDIHIAEVLTYLKLTNTKLGLLLNFNVLKLKDGIKRVVNGL